VSYERDKKRTDRAGHRTIMMSACHLRVYLYDDSRFHINTFFAFAAVHWRCLDSVFRFIGWPTKLSPAGVPSNSRFTALPENPRHGDKDFGKG